MAICRAALIMVLFSESWALSNLRNAGKKVSQPDAESDNALFGRGLGGDANSESDAALYADVASEQSHTFQRPRDGANAESDNALFATERIEKTGHTSGDADPESDAALFNDNSFLQLAKISHKKASQPDAESDHASFDRGSNGDADSEPDAALYANVAARDGADAESDNALFATERIGKIGHTLGDADPESDAALFDGGSFLQFSSTRNKKGSQPNAESDNALFGRGSSGDANSESDAALYADAASEQSHDFSKPHYGADAESDNALFASERIEKRGHTSGDADPESDAALFNAGSLLQLTVKDKKTSQPDAESDNALFGHGDANSESDAALYADVASEQSHTFQRPHDGANAESDNALFATERIEKTGHTSGDADPESDAALFNGDSFLQVANAKNKKLEVPSDATRSARVSGEQPRLPSSHDKSDAKSNDILSARDRIAKMDIRSEVLRSGDTLVQLAKNDKKGILTVPVPVAPEVFPVPTTCKCIVIMCCHYMLIYVALAVCRTFHEITGTAKGGVEAGLRVATQTVTYGPMICVLFIACRMRVEFLSGGKDQPQIWVQHCMYFVTWSVIGNTLLVLLMPMLIGKPAQLKEGTCDLEKPKLEEADNKIVFYVLTVARYLIMLGLYGGIAGIIVGMSVYLPPGVEDISKVPPPAPAVMCSMVLAVVFFLTQLVIAGCNTYEEFMGVSFPKVLGVANGAATTVEFAPMLSILFLAARMRALQHDAQPQEYAQACMYLATGALILTTILAILVPLVVNGTMKTNPATNEVRFEAPDDPLGGYVLLFVRYLCMVGFYGSALVIAYSIFAFVAPAGPQATLPVSPTVDCVVNLTFQFFFVYAAMTMMLTVSELSGGRYPLETYRFFSGLEATKATLGFAPMLSILFVATRMYALLITDGKGAPPAWVQDAMYMATWSLMISSVSCMFTSVFMDKVVTDEDGNVINKFSNQYIAATMIVIRYMTILLLYGGMTIVICGLFIMTPETANGRGSIFFVTETIGSSQFGHAPTY